MYVTKNDISGVCYLLGSGSGSGSGGSGSGGGMVCPPLEPGMTTRRGMYSDQEISVVSWKFMFCH